MLVVAACTVSSDPTTTTSLDPTTTTSTTTVQRSTTSTSAKATTTSASATSTVTAPVFAATISDVSVERLSHSWKSDCPTEVEHLVLVSLQHWDLSGEVRDGSIVVARNQSEHVVEIFKRLFELGYPIESIIPIGDLPEDIEDDDPDYNNTSGLHCRYVAGTNRWSEHARGLAIDINPLWNPYVTASTIWPSNSEEFLDRSNRRPGMIFANDDVVAAFEQNGWFWGGYWTSSKDYQHFSVNNR